MFTMPAVPLAIAAPAAAAGLAYLSAKTKVAHDYPTISAGLKAALMNRLRERWDCLNMFYVLEGHAQGILADEVFLVFEGRQWTYKETYQTVLKYGTWIKSKFDVRPKQIVAMDFMNSEKFVFVWFGLWSIGAKPAFINYNLSGKPLVHCIKVSSTSLAFVDLEVKDNVSSDVIKVLPNVRFVIFTPELEKEVTDTVGIRAPDWTRSEDKSSNMAKLVYTSGTTGLPKPAIVSWMKAGMGSMIMSNVATIRRPDVFYTSMPLYHSSASMLGFSATLYVGATVALGKKFSTKTFWDDCRDSNATIIQYVGETCRYLLAAAPQIDPKTGKNLDKKNSVRMAVGNGLRPDVWNRFKERFGIDTISEFYGATEGVSASFNYSRNDFSRGAIGRYGFFGSLLLKRSWHIVELDWETETPWRDPVTGFCKKVNPGEPGEMLYKLDETNIERTFQGYFENKRSTEGKIMRNVFVKGDAYFRTGNVLSWDHEGRIFFNDRIGDTFRWKSENVSTSEVSEALGTHPAVHEANVYGVELPHHNGRAGCVAIILADETTPTLLQSLADHVIKALPRFAVPLFLRIPKKIQMTGTNKQQKHHVRLQGINPAKTEGDEFFWLKGGSYVPFRPRDWEDLNNGSVKL